MSPILLAHRGYSEKYPENTRIAFLKGLETRAKGVELDVQKTKDGVFVIFHDDVLDRTTPLKGRLLDITWDEILLKRGEDPLTRIHTLKEFLEYYPKSAFLNIELKKETLETTDLELICALVSKHREVKNTLYSTFNHEWLEPLKKLGQTVGWLIGDEQKSWGAKRVLDTAFLLKPHFLNIPIQLFQELGFFKAILFVLFLKSKGFKIAFWTINSKADYFKIKLLSDIVITDCPDNIV